jgi:hypothetical protein
VKDEGGRMNQNALARDAFILHPSYFILIS